MSRGASRGVGLGPLCALCGLGLACADEAPRAGGVERDAGLDAAAQPGPADAGAAPGDAGEASTPVLDPWTDAAAPLEPLSLPVGTDGTSELAFDVPGDARGFVLTLVARPGAGEVRLLALRGPDGAALHREGASVPGARPVSTRSPSAWFPLSIAWPPRPPLAVDPGRHRVTLWTDAGDALQADLRILPPPRTAPRRLPVSLWFAAGSGLDAATAANSEPLQGALGALGDILGQAGITLEVRELRDLASDPGLARVGDDATLFELAEALSTARATGLRYVFVESLERDGQPERARTTGIPLPPPHVDRSRPGLIAVSLDAAPAEPARLAELLAHEAAHALGLGHTSERDGARHDPLDDTPECPTDRASRVSESGAPLLSAADCADLGALNLLFPVPPEDDTPQRELTPDQVEMMRASPLVD